MVIFLTLVSVALGLFVAESLGVPLWLGSDLLAALSLAGFVYGVGLTVLVDWQQFISQFQPANIANERLPSKDAESDSISSDPLGPDSQASLSNSESKPITKPKVTILDPETALQVYAEVYAVVTTQALWREPKFRLADLAQATGFAEHYLSFVINQQSGCNSQLWLNQFRVKAAQALLRTTELPVLSVALQVGFNSKATFNRVFKDVAGQSPTEYRHAATSTKAPNSEP